MKRPGLERGHGYRCTVFPPGWKRPFRGLSLQTLTQGSDPFSLPTEKLLASSNNVQVYVHVNNVFMLLPVGGGGISQQQQQARPYF